MFVPPRFAESLGTESSLGERAHFLGATGFYTLRDEQIAHADFSNG
jgi:hypothetical protein